MKGKVQLIMLLVAIASAVVMAGSTYGMGKEAGNKDGPGYKSGAAFTGISATLLAIAIILLFLG